MGIGISSAGLAAAASWGERGSLSWGGADQLVEKCSGEDSEEYIYIYIVAFQLLTRHKGKIILLLFLKACC